MEEQEESNEPMEVNNSASDTSSSDDEEEQMLTAKAEDLERQISDNKYLYDAHADLVSLYRRLGDLKSMRLAYERFHEYFPLTPELWLAWINDEKKLAGSEGEIRRVFELFDRAVRDYTSVNLWIEYAQFSIGAGDLDTARAVLERGLTSCGLHAADGALLWDTLRELELAHLSLTPDGSERRDEQIRRVADVFRRQLSVPLLGMEATHAEWTEWLSRLPDGHGVDPEPVEWAYKRALKTLERYRPFEERLRAAADDAELLRVYREYAKALDDPSTTLCVYERAVSRLCLVPSLWLDYCLYALRLGDAADAVSERALRNCPWSEELWAMRLRVLERLRRPDADALACFEQGLASVAGAAAELWLAYLEYTRRTADGERLRKLFDQALEQLPGEVKVAKWYARVLAGDGDVAAARRLWKDVVKRPQNRGIAAVWLEYAALERRHGEAAQARAVFQRALAACTDWPQCVADEWLAFERELGGLEDVLKCVEKCREIAELTGKNEELTGKNVELTGKRVELTGKNAELTGKRAELTGRKRKLEEGDAEPTVRHRKTAPVAKDPTTTVFVSNLYPSVGEKRLRRFFPDAVAVELVSDRKGRSRCYGYVQFASEEEVGRALARDREPLDGRPVFVSSCRPSRGEREAAFKYSSTVEANKLFVKGLPAEASREEVEAVFAPFGAKEVRLVVQKSGRSKGLAYVEFEDAESAERARKATDGTEVGGRRIAVAVSAPPPKGAKQPRAAPARHARSKLQVPLIPRSLQVKRGEDSNGEVKSAAAPKSNEDFRKLLLNA